MNVEIGTEAAQFLVCEYIDGIFVAVFAVAEIGFNLSSIPYPLFSGLCLCREKRLVSFT